MSDQPFGGPVPDTTRMARGMAFGKVILLGEHAVVHGGTAIAAGIDREALAVAQPASGEPSSLRLGGRQIAVGESPADDVARAFEALIGVLAPSFAIDIDAESSLPPGGGLGSSAALGVAIARSIVRLVRGADDEVAVLAAARAWEGVFHGTPSGIDTHAAAHGGCFTFSRARGAEPLLPQVDLVLCIGSTGVASSTREMVASVARLKERRPEIVEKSLEGIGSLVSNAALAIQAGDLTGLGKLMDLNQMILAGLMLSTEAIETVCRTARDAGALGAKLTGAGGGGAVIALVPSSRHDAAGVTVEAADDAARAILDAWKAAGFPGFVARIPGRLQVLG